MKTRCMGLLHPLFIAPTFRNESVAFSFEPQGRSLPLVSHVNLRSVWEDNNGVVIRRNSIGNDDICADRSEVFLFDQQVAVCYWSGTDRQLSQVILRWLLKTEIWLQCISGSGKQNDTAVSVVSTPHLLCTFRISDTEYHVIYPKSGLA
jgi:hypothetical protein